MTNRPKQRGTAAETAVVRWCQANGFPWSERLTLTGAHDRGDISLIPGHAVIVEVKAHATAATGQPTAGQLAAWMAETETERSNAGADIGVLVVKRKGTTDVGQWWAYITAGAFAGLVGAPAAHFPDRHAPWCGTFEHVALLLRNSGYGSEIEETA